MSPPSADPSLSDVFQQQALSAVPDDLVFLIDSSASMVGGPLETALSLARTIKRRDGASAFIYSTEGILPINPDVDDAALSGLSRAAVGGAVTVTSLIAWAETRRDTRIVLVSDDDFFSDDRADSVRALNEYLLAGKNNWVDFLTLPRRQKDSPALPTDIVQDKNDPCCPQAESCALSIDEAVQAFDRMTARHMRPLREKQEALQNAVASVYTGTERALPALSFNLRKAATA